MAASSKQASHDTVSFVYEHFLANPAAVTVAVRALYGSSKQLRSALENQLNAAAREMAEDMIERNLATSVAHATIQEISVKSPG
jgi:hypothetical protein